MADNGNNNSRKHLPQISLLNYMSPQSKKLKKAPDKEVEDSTRERGKGEKRKDSINTVSYTHLTLPTIA